MSDLQAQNNSPRPQPPPARNVQNENEDVDDDDDEEMEDDQDAGEGTSTPATLEPSASGVSLPSLSQITTTTTTSPSIFSANGGRNYSISSAASSYSPYFHSNQASPAFGPQLHHVNTAPAYGSAFGLGSPALKPLDSSSHLRHIAEGATELSDKQRSASKSGRRERELDQEATAALLMLNHDRRNWRAAQEAEGGRSSTGMSVKDLLSG